MFSEKLNFERRLSISIDLKFTLKNRNEKKIERKSLFLWEMAVIKRRKSLERKKNWNLYLQWSVQTAVLAETSFLIDSIMILLILRDFIWLGATCSCLLWHFTIPTCIKKLYLVCKHAKNISLWQRAIRCLIKSLFCIILECNFAKWRWLSYILRAKSCKNPANY